MESGGNRSVGKYAELRKQGMHGGQAFVAIAMDGTTSETGYALGAMNRADVRRRKHGGV